MPIDLSAVVVLVLGGLAVHVAHRKPDMGQALGLGAVIVTHLMLLLQPHRHRATRPRRARTPCSWRERGDCSAPRTGG
ncbi:hypothetical protein QA811_40300 [Streptomyces sp. B21-102]|uniref:hypothetical protein n=1 Tax=Streptomyces sp. B21-102 TaxID=3039416 RepID=UPI002FEE8FCF